MRTLLLSFCLLMATAAAAQSLPPVFGTEATWTDELTRAYLVPKSIVWMQGDITHEDVLLTPGNEQPDMAGTPTCILRTGESDTTSLLLDYGRELHGGLKLVIGSANAASTKVRIRFGESVGECCAEPDGGQNRTGFASNDHATRDDVYLVPRYGQIEIGSTGFRFVRIDLLAPDRRLQVKEAAAILRYRDIPYVGSFRSSDARLDSIWMTGAYTVHLCMQEYLWDGIKRDRAVWLGDMHPEVETILSVFGQNDVVPRSLDLAVEQYPLPRWLNGISSYSMWYLIIQHDWYMHGGDRAFLERHQPYIMGLIDKIDPLVDADGTEHLEENTRSQLKRFLDWPSSPNAAGVEAGYRALLAWAMRDAERLCTVLGDEAHAATCRNIALRLAKKILPDNELQQARALKMIAGQEKPNGNFTSEGFSTFYGYYMLQALAMAGCHQQAIDIIREYWGAMLDLGATTFWEDFHLDWVNAPDPKRKLGVVSIDSPLLVTSPDDVVDVHRDYGDYCYLSYRHSFCHGWASGPTAWLTRHVLGVEVMEPGCRTLQITPHLGDLTWVEGSFPTPLGPVALRHERQADGRIHTSVNAPEGITCIVKSSD